MLHAYDPNYWGRLRQEDLKLEASLGNIEKLCLKKIKKVTSLPSILNY